MGNVGYPIAVCITTAAGIASSIAAFFPDVTAATRLAWALSLGVGFATFALKYRKSQQQGAGVQSNEAKRLKI